MQTAMIELTRKEMNEFDTWMKQFAYDFAAKIDTGKYEYNPIRKFDNYYQQKQVLCSVREVEDKILAEVARILGVSSVERTSYGYFQEDVEWIIEMINPDIDLHWHIEATNDHLYLVRDFHSFKELWNADLDYLVPQSERPSEHGKVLIEFHLESSESGCLDPRYIQNALIKALGASTRIHGIQTLVEPMKYLQTYRGYEMFQKDNKVQVLWKRHKVDYTGQIHLFEDIEAAKSHIDQWEDK